MIYYPSNQLVVMSDQERSEILKSVEKTKKKLAKDEKASKDFLIDLGIYTRKGNLKRNYKHLCIQPDQD